MMIKQNVAPFIPTQNRQLLMKVILIMYLNQYIELIYQTYQNL